MTELTFEKSLLIVWLDVEYAEIEDLNKLE